MWEHSIEMAPIPTDPGVMQQCIGLHYSTYNTELLCVYFVHPQSLVC